MITARFRKLSCALALLLAFMSLLAVAGPPANKASAAVSGFVTRSGSQLMLNGQPFRYGGPNIYWLALDENPVEYPTEFRVNNALQTAKKWARPSSAPMPPSPSAVPSASCRRSAPTTRPLSRSSTTRSKRPAMPDFASFFLDRPIRLLPRRQEIMDALVRLSRRRHQLYRL